VREEGSNDLFVEEEERGGVKYKKHATSAWNTYMVGMDLRCII
jgi:hypothetical protein